MEKPESIQKFYERNRAWVPEHWSHEIGNFNVFTLAPFSGGNPKVVPYRKRDFYKISLIIGNNRVLYADKVVEVQKHALVFTNPQIPYSWEQTETIQGGYYCVFDPQFFYQFGSLSSYPVFQPAGTHVFELTPEQVGQVSQVFLRMQEEIASNYAHKYDALRNMVYELLHFAMKLQPTSLFDAQPINASQRISTLFLELLERQFPIDESHRQVQLRSASDFAEQLNVHVNHLNRAVKEASGKTTTQIIGERIAMEAKILLKHSLWNVSEVAYALGFGEATHFNNFFKKHTGVSPLKFRSV